jgi:hypothetical protein
MDSHAMRYGAAAWSAWRIAFFFFAVILWLSRGVGCSVLGRRLWYTLLLRCNLVGVGRSCGFYVRGVLYFQSWNLPPDGLQSVSVHKNEYE